nr:unnamed protein product [Callosobruchus chinensis]
MKLLLLITVICVFAPLVSAGVIVNLHQSIEDGLVSCKNTSAPGDLQVQENVHVEPQFFAVVETSITIPGEGFFSKPISCILVEDQRTDGSGGVVSITDGGINQFRVTFHMISKRGKGLDYSVKVYT